MFLESSMCFARMDRARISAARAAVPLSHEMAGNAALGGAEATASLPQGHQKVNLCPGDHSYMSVSVAISINSPPC